MPTKPDDVAPTDAPIPAPIELIPLGNVPDSLPRRGTKKVHKSSPFRWAAIGACGIRLRTVSIARQKCTTLRWIGEWSAAVDAARRAANEPKPARRPTRRRRA